MTADRSGTPVWIWIGTGCLLAVVLFVAVVGGLFYYGFRKTREFEQTMKDPVARTEQALELLGAESLPDGYHAVTAFSVPLLMETVILSDREAEIDERGDMFDEHGLIYVKSLAFGDHDRQLEDLFEGRTDDADLIRQSPIDLRQREQLDRGSFQEPDRTVRWAVYRGEVAQRSFNESGEALSSIVLIDCPDDDRRRLAIWFGPDPDPEAPANRVDLTGSVGDPEEIRSFLRHFDLCRT